MVLSRERAVNLSSVSEDSVGFTLVCNDKMTYLTRTRTHGSRTGGPVMAGVQRYAYGAHTRGSIARLSLPYVVKAMTTI